MTKKAKSQESCNLLTGFETINVKKHLGHLSSSIVGSGKDLKLYSYHTANKDSFSTPLNLGMADTTHKVRADGSLLGKNSLRTNFIERQRKISVKKCFVI